MLRHCVALATLVTVAVPALAQDPDAEMRFGAAVRLLRDGFPDRALVEIEAALKKEPDNAFYLKGMSVAYSQLADKCKPNDSGCRNNNLKKAIDAAQKALIANPDYVDARNDLGIALLRLGKRTDGKAELAKAFADPQCPTPEVTAWNLGQAFFEEKEYNEAMTWFQAAVNKNKTLAAGYVSIAEILVILGQADAAIAQLEVGMKEASGNSAVQLALGDAYLKAGRFQDARAAYEGVIKKDPAGPSGRQAMMRLKEIAK
ncbi:MAG: tetratricopeptide repeat protein [Vicinamibacteria bacterium]|nr:tetratricopeptide repeat protein [Vicinamibacteria bacterium]